MSNLARHPQDAVPRLAIHHESPADPRAQRDHAEIVNVIAGAQPLLSQGGTIGVIVEKYRCVQSLCQVVSGVIALPAREVGGGVKPTVFDVNDAGQADTHSEELMRARVFLP